MPLGPALLNLLKCCKEQLRLAALDVTQFHPLNSSKCVFLKYLLRVEITVGELFGSTVSKCHVNYLVKTQKFNEIYCEEENEGFGSSMD